MNEESRHQIALFRWAALQSNAIPALRMLLAIPNGGMRSKATAGRLKAEGVKAGCPDICLPVRSGAYGCLFLEMKRPKEPGKPKGRLSEVQKQWLGDLQAYGQCVGIAYGWLEAKEIILAYLRGEA